MSSTALAAALLGVALLILIVTSIVDALKNRRAVARSIGESWGKAACLIA